MKEYDCTKKANFLLFWVPMIGGKLKLRMQNRRIIWECPKKKFRHTPVILIANHSACFSFFSALSGFPLHRNLKGVASNIRFGNDVYGFIAEKCKSIPIRQFVSDLTAVFHMAKCVRAGQSLILFPEGIESWSGMTHPIFPSTAAFLKEMKTDVLLAMTEGEFLTCPTFVNDTRKGFIETRYSHLFTKEELEEISVSEIEERLADALRYNDFKWNEEKHFHYKGKYPCAKGLQRILYYCPKCGGDETLYTRGDLIICRECGNTIRCDDTYAIAPNGTDDVLPYRRIDEWYLDCRKRFRKKLRLPKDISLSYDVKLGLRCSDYGKPKFERAGEGTLSIDKTGTRYRGTENGEETELFIPIKRSFGADIYERDHLVLYDKSRTLSFEFSDDGPHIVKAEAAIEEFHALVDPDWDRALCRAYYPEEL